MKHLWISLLLFSLFTSSGWCAPRPQRYELRSRPVPAEALYEAQDDVWLWDNQKKRILWKRRLDLFRRVTWSHDHKGMSLEAHDKGWRVLVWREKSRLHEFAPVEGYDYPMGTLWSPDSRRLLVRYGHSADTDVDSGALFCLELKRWPRYRYFSIGDAHKMVWKNNRTVVFWDWTQVDPPKLTSPRVWRVPVRSRRHPLGMILKRGSS